MPSPFPGMNPYLEQEDVWRDFRLSFTVAASRQLQPLLSPQHFAMIRVKEFFYEASELGRADALQPDAIVNVSSRGSLPVRLPTTDKDRESYIEICDAKSREAVTVIQLLSRSTKYAVPPPHREQYLAHRIEALWSAGPLRRNRPAARGRPPSSERRAGGRLLRPGEPLAAAAVGGGVADATPGAAADAAHPAGGRHSRCATRPSGLVAAGLGRCQVRLLHLRRRTRSATVH